MRFLTCSLLVLGLSGCAMRTVPEYTSLLEMRAVEPGMTLEQVTEVLGPEPYDMYVLGDQEVYVWHYRRQVRRVRAARLRTRVGQTGGRELMDDPGLVFAMFDEGRLERLYTGVGRDDLLRLRTWDNTVQIAESHPEQVNYLRARLAEELDAEAEEDEEPRRGLFRWLRGR